MIFCVKEEKEEEYEDMEDFRKLEDSKAEEENLRMSGSRDSIGVEGGYSSRTSLGRNEYGLGI